jgi:hypothetical protein
MQCDVDGAIRLESAIDLNVIQVHRGTKNC